MNINICKNLKTKLTYKNIKFYLKNIIKNVCNI